MAMNKSEKAEMDRLRSDLAKAKALRWPDYAPERIDPKEALREAQRQNLVQAWCFNAWREGNVSFGCFNSINHSVNRSDRTTTQGQGGPWFPTRRDALMALRLAKTEEFASALARLDEEIRAASDSEHGQ